MEKNGERAKHEVLGEEIDKYEVITNKGKLFKETATFFDVEKAIEHAQKRESEGYSVKIRKISYIVWK